MKVRVRGKGKSAELLRAPYSKVKKRCIETVIGKIPLERKLFDFMPRLSTELEEKLTKEEVDTVVTPWLKKHLAEIEESEEVIAVNQVSVVLKRLASGLKKQSIHDKKAGVIYALLEDVKNALEITGHPLPKKPPAAKKTSARSKPAK